MDYTLLDFFKEHWMAIATYFVFLFLLLAFMAGATRRTPAQERAEMDQQYRDLNGIK